MVLGKIMGSARMVSILPSLSVLTLGLKKSILFLMTLVVLTLGYYGQLLSSQGPILCLVNWQMFMVLATGFIQQVFNVHLLMPRAILSTWFTEMNKPVIGLIYET